MPLWNEMWFINFLNIYYLWQLLHWYTFSLSSVEIWYFSDVQYNIFTMLVRFESWNSRYQFFQFCVIYIRRFIWEFGKYFVDLLFNVTDFKERQKSAAVFTILYIIIIVSIMFCHMQTNCFDIPTFLFSVLFWVFFLDILPKYREHFPWYFISY